MSGFMKKSPFVSLRLPEFKKGSFASYSYENLLSSIAESPSSIYHLQQIHSLIITNGFSSKSVLSCRLITSYASLCGLEHAHQVFDALPKRTTHAYNHLLKALVDRNRYRSAFALYSVLLSDKTVSPDPVTFSIVIKACVGLGLERGGKMIHAHVLACRLEGDLRLASDLLQLYMKDGCLEHARKLFEVMPQRDCFVWTCMIDGLLRSGAYGDAVKVFQDMRDSDYKASDVTWNALISGFARGGLYDDALRHMKLMQLDGVRPGGVVLSSILPMFAQYALLKPGLEVHAYAIRNGWEADLFVVSALVSMYAKCGRMSSALCLFDCATVRDNGLWNSIIVGYGMHGHCREALSLFNRMIESGVRPCERTFTAILSACSHRGMVSDGRRVFSLMVNDYKISARHEHYACMVDMLGRAGLLEEAYEFITRMQKEPTRDTWGAFLSACSIHSNTKFMKIAAEHMILKNKTGDAAGYHVMVSNMYAQSGQWKEMAKLRTQIKDKRLKKTTGYSWIEIGDVVHIFRTADLAHPQSKEIYILLRRLSADISRVFVVD